MSMIDYMINPIASEVGAAVAGAIRDAGRTKLWVSDETGIPYPTLNRKVAGKSEFALSELASVAEALGTTPSRFIPATFLPAEAVAS